MRQLISFCFLYHLHLTLHIATYMIVEITCLLKQRLPTEEIRHHPPISVWVHIICRHSTDPDDLASIDQVGRRMDNEGCLAGSTFNL